MRRFLRRKCGDCGETGLPRLGFVLGGDTVTCGICRCRYEIGSVVAYLFSVIDLALLAGGIFYSVVSRSTIPFFVALGIIFVIQALLLPSLAKRKGGDANEN